MTGQNQFNTEQFDPADIQANKVVSGFAYFGILFFLPLVAAPQSRYGRFHANQGLILLILGVIVGIINGILGSISARILINYYYYGSGPIFFTYIIGFITWILGIAMLVLFIIGMINGFTGKAKELPIIGKIRLIK